MQTENLSPQSRREWFFAALEKLSRRPYLLLAAACITAAFAIDVTAMSNTFLQVFSITGFAVLTAILCFTKKSKLTDRRVAFILISAGFLLRLVYILYTTVETRQHDVWFFSGKIGHAGYIRYIYDNLKLPDTNPMYTWQYYHAPLHHILAAAWMRLNTALGLSFERACEKVQILTMFYSSACMIITYRILNFFKFKGLAFIIPLAIVCFHPTFVIMGGCINNDILSVMFMFGAVWTALKWYEKPTLVRIIPVALCIGLAMMAKTSGVLVAPAVAFIFLIKFVKDIQNYKKYLLQFAVFGIICVPIGMWWSVYNYIKWDMPFGYVAELSKAEKQYIPQYSAFERFFSFNENQFSNIFQYGNEKIGYYEYNIFVTLFKTSVFGESSLFDTNAMETAANFLGYTLCVCLFYVNIILALVSFVGAILLIWKKKYLYDSTVTCFFVILWTVVMAFFFKFCLEYPFTCSMDFRYIVPTLLVGVVFLGKLLEVVEEKREKAFYRVMQSSICVLSVLFCIMSLEMFFLLG